MDKKMSDAQKKAITKYLKKLKSITIRVSPEDHERYKRYCDKKKISMRSFMLHAMDTYMEQNP